MFEVLWYLTTLFFVIFAFGQIGLAGWYLMKKIPRHLRVLACGLIVCLVSFLGAFLAASVSGGVPASLFIRFVWWADLVGIACFSYWLTGIWCRDRVVRALCASILVLAIIFFKTFLFMDVLFGMMEDVRWRN